MYLRVYFILLFVAVAVCFSSNSKAFEFDLSQEVGIIYGEKSAGTVTMLHPHYGITNYHVANGYDSMHTVLGVMDKADVLIIARDKENDLALVYFDNAHSYLSLCKESVDVGRDIYIQGITKMMRITTKGLFQGVASNMAVSTAQIRPGMSGSPLMLDNNCVVGINHSFEVYTKISTGKTIGSDITYAAPMHIVAEFMIKNIKKHQASLLDADEDE